MISFLHEGRPAPAVVLPSLIHSNRERINGGTRGVVFDGVGARPYYVVEYLWDDEYQTRHFNVREAIADYNGRMNL